VQDRHRRKARQSLAGLVPEACREDRERGSAHSRAYHGARGQEVLRDDSERRLRHSRSPCRMQETRREDSERRSAHSRSYHGAPGQEARRDDSALYKMHNTRREDRESTLSHSIHGVRGQETRREHWGALSRSFHREYEARGENREGATARYHSDQRTTNSQRAMSPGEEQHLLAHILKSPLHRDFRYGIYLNTMALTYWCGHVGGSWAPFARKLACSRVNLGGNLAPQARNRKVVTQ
jgi:hypothetical protein